MPPSQDPVERDLLGGLRHTLAVIPSRADGEGSLIRSQGHANNPSRDQDGCRIEQSECTG